MSARNARDLAYHTVRSRIITMELKPGDPLNDRELAEELGISRTPMREALILLNNAHMVAIKPQSGTHVAPIDLHLMELEQFSRYTLEKEILTRMCGRLTPEQEAGYRQLIEAYRVLEASPEEPDREMRLLELDNAFHRRAFELCGMEHHFDHMLASLACGAHPQVQPADQREQGRMRGPYPHPGCHGAERYPGAEPCAGKPPEPLQADGGGGPAPASGLLYRRPGAVNQKDFERAAEPARFFVHAAVESRY